MIRHMTRLFVLLSLLSSSVLTADPLGTAFTYQGRLTDGGQPANGSYDLKFTLYDDPNSGNAVGLPVATNGVAVSNGLFTVRLDFGQVIGRYALWLEIGVRSNGVPVDFRRVSPRQELTPTPYAIYANDAGTAVEAHTVSPGSIYSSSFSPGAVNSAALANGAVTGAHLQDGTITAHDVSPNTFWRMDGNAGTTPGPQFLGTTDNQPLEFRVNGLRALRLEDNGDSVGDADELPNGSPNVIGGSPANLVAAGVVGATISGGGATHLYGAAHPNLIAADYATIGGGRDNTTSGGYAMIGGGASNTIEAWADYATIGGGTRNTIQTNADFVTIGGGAWNAIQTNARSATIGGGEYNRIQPTAECATIGGGAWNAIQSVALWATIGGGAGNTIQTLGHRATLGGGYQNTIETYAEYASLCGGGYNTIQSNAAASTISGGYANTIQTNAYSATIPGGSYNSATNCAFAAGRRAKANHTGTFVWADSTDADFESTGINQFSIRATGGSRYTTPELQLWHPTASYGSTARLVFGDLHRVFIQEDVDDKLLINAYTRTAIMGGPLGVGTLSPQASLHVASDGGVPQLFLEQTAASDWARLRLGGGGHTWDISVRDANEPSINFWNGSANAMVVSYFGTVTATAFNPSSDRDRKENLEPVNPREVLDKVAAMPMASWNFKTDPAIRHLGPMAQDFHAAFGLGTDDRHIATVDADGVALAAIQGLNQKLEEQRRELSVKSAEIQELRQALAELRNLLTRQSAN
jgi:hypothetical protein